MHFFRITALAESGAAHFKHIKNFDDDFELVEGVSLLDEIPADAEYRMSADYPDDIQLHDFLHNLDRQLIVNSKVREFLEKHINKVEFLPVNIVNHKGRNAKESYFIVNLLDLEDCIDKEKTTFEWSKLDPELMKSVTNLTLNESSYPKKRHLFRLKHLTSVIMISESLVQELKNEGFRGFAISELIDYQG